MMKTPTDRKSSKRSPQKSRGASQQAAKSPKHSPGDSSSQGSHRQTATVESKARKKSPRPGTREEPKRRGSSKEKTIRKSKPPKLQSIRKKKDFKVKSTEGSVFVDEGTMDLPKSFVDASNEFETAAANFERQYKSFGAMTGIVKNCAQLAGIPLESEQEHTAYITLLCSCGHFIAKMLSLYVKQRPDLAGPIAEKCFTWPLLWYPTECAQKRAYDEIAELNVGKALSFKIDTATRSDAAYTEIASMIHQIVASLREPAQLLSIFDPGVKYTNCLNELIEAYDKLNEKDQALLAETELGHNISFARHQLNKISRSFRIGTNSVNAFSFSIYVALLRMTFCKPIIQPLAVMQRFQSRCRSLPPPSKDSLKAWDKLGLDIFKYISGGEPEKNIALESPIMSQIPESEALKSKTPEAKLKAKRKAIDQYFKRMFRKQLRMQPEDDHD